MEKKYSAKDVLKITKDTEAVDEMNRANLRVGLVLLPVVIAFEIFMMVMMQTKLSVGKTMYGAMYMSCYIVLLIASAVVLAAMFVMRRNMERYRRPLIVVTNLYLLVMISWAAGVTYLDLMRGGEITVYLTILVIFAVSIYLQPWAAIAAFSASSILLIILGNSIDVRAAGVAINTVVFAAFMITLSIVRYNDKKESVQSARIVRRQNEELSSLNEKLRVVSQTDRLTGLYNRWHFDRSAPEMMEDCVRKHENISMIMADIDKFKSVNDLFGHKTGDVCISTAAYIFAKHVKAVGGIAYRFGGEEFLAVIPDCSRKSADAVARRICEEVGSTIIENVGHPLTMSVGCYGGIPQAAEELDAYVNRADAAMYCAKDEGRNRVAVHWQTEKDAPQIEGSAKVQPQ